MRKGEKFKWIQISRREYNQLTQAEGKVTSVKVYKRIQAFKLMYKKWKYGAIADFLNVRNDTITDWISIYTKEGIDGLLNLHYKGGQPKLSSKQLSELQSEAGKGSFAFAKDIQKYIEKNFGIKYNLKHIQLLAKKNFNYPLRKQEKIQESTPT